MVGDEILKSGNSHIVIEKSEVILLSLSELKSDWCWVVSDEILESRNSHIVIQKSKIVFLDVHLRI